MLRQAELEFYRDEIWMKRIIASFIPTVLVVAILYHRRTYRKIATSGQNFLKSLDQNTPNSGSSEI